MIPCSRFVACFLVGLTNPSALSHSGFVENGSDSKPVRGHIRLTPETREVEINYQVPESVVNRLGAGAGYGSYDKILRATEPVTLLYRPGSCNRPPRFEMKGADKPQRSMALAPVRP